MIPGWTIADSVADSVADVDAIADVDVAVVDSIAIANAVVDAIAVADPVSNAGANTGADSIGNAVSDNGTVWPVGTKRALAFPASRAARTISSATLILPTAQSLPTVNKIGALTS